MGHHLHQDHRFLLLRARACSFDLWKCKKLPRIYRLSNWVLCSWRQTLSKQEVCLNSKFSKFQQAMSHLHPSRELLIWAKYSSKEAQQEFERSTSWSYSIQCIFHIQMNAFDNWQRSNHIDFQSNDVFSILIFQSRPSCSRSKSAFGFYQFTQISFHETISR